MERMGIKPVKICDGPHGVRENFEHMGAVFSSYKNGIQDNGVGVCAAALSILV